MRRGTQLKNHLMKLLFCLKHFSRLLCIQQRGIYEDKDIADMDQTSLPFILDDKTTYSTTNVKDA